jgi:hypothetical protein
MATNVKRPPAGDLADPHGPPGKNFQYRVRRKKLNRFARGTAGGFLQCTWRCTSEGELVCTWNVVLTE